MDSVQTHSPENLDPLPHAGKTHPNAVLWVFPLLGIFLWTLLPWLLSQAMFSNILEAYREAGDEPNLAVVIVDSYVILSGSLPVGIFFSLAFVALATVLYAIIRNPMLRLIYSLLFFILGFLWIVFCLAGPYLGLMSIPNLVE